MTLVSVVIPCYNEAKTIGLLLEALYNQSYPRSKMEVIISDGMSNDTTRNVIDEFCEAFQDLSIKVIDNAQRTIPAGLNRAIEAARGDVIVRLDAHSVPTPQYIALCVENLEAGKGDNVGGVWQIEPGEASWMAESIALAASHPLGVGDARYRTGGQACSVDTVPFGAFRRELIGRIGKFDESLLTNEDYEFNARVRQAGGKVWLDPRVRTVYYARPDLGSLARQYWRYGYWKLKMLRRYPQTLRWRQALPPVLVLSLIGLALMAFVVEIGRVLLGLEVALYALALIAAAIPPAYRQRNWKYIIGIPVSIATMHLAWGMGFLVSLLKRS